MKVKLNRIERFGLFMAGADTDILSSARMPRWQRIRYSVIGNAVAAANVLATVAWTHQGLVTFPDAPWNGVAIGVGMGLVMFTLERVVVVTLQPGMNTIQKIVALSWRGMLATINATILALPMALTTFGGDAALQLDDERYALMQAKRTQARQIFALQPHADAVAAVTAAIETNRKERAVLPASVRELMARRTACEAERVRLRAALVPRIDQAEQQRASQGLGEPGQPPAVQQDFADRDNDIQRWQRELSRKDAACAAVAREAASARNAFYAANDRAYDSELKLHALKQGELDRARQDADSAVAISDRAISGHVARGLGNDVRALARYLRTDVFGFLMVLAYWVFGWIIDMMPALSKVTVSKSSPYEKTVLAQQRKLAAEIDADALETENRFAARSEAGAVELDVMRRFREDEGRRQLLERARELARLDNQTARVLAEVQSVHLVVQAFEDAQSRLDETESRFGGREDTFDNIQELQALLLAKMRKASRELQDSNEGQGDNR